ncbi:MAG: signal peptide peptidase SppA [Candidatus Zixiibacteriota bacterium]|nr:MAG: signal peptide peptidase SppA [candidate division Zixibacteria bacterium]
MARTRDVVVAVIIGGAFLVAFAFFALMFVGLFSSSDGIDLAGLGDNVGVVDLFGTIEEASGRIVIEQLDRWADNSSIEAVVIHINSPGGGVAISQEVFDAVSRLAAEKPVVAAMAEIAASGGYYVACGADRIVANPGSLTGSIGVIFQFHTFGGLMDKVGIGTETIKSGEFKDVGTYEREMTKKEELMLRSVVMDSYEQFLQVVAESRSQELDDVRRLADGSIYTGVQAYNLGLVDTLGGLHEAIQVAAELAGLGGKPSVVRPYRREKIGIFDLIGSVLGNLGHRLENQVGGPRLLYLYQ